MFEAWFERERRADLRAARLAFVARGQAAFDVFPALRPLSARVASDEELEAQLDRIAGLGKE